MNFVFFERLNPFLLLVALLVFMTGNILPDWVAAKTVELSDRGKAADTNKDGLIQENEARGPLEANFDDMDCDKNGGLDGAEIRGFFSGEGCPKKAVAKSTTDQPRKKLSLIHI